MGWGIGGWGDGMDGGKGQQHLNGGVANLRYRHDLTLT